MQGMNSYYVAACFGDENATSLAIEVAFMQRINICCFG